MCWPFSRRFLISRIDTFCSACQQAPLSSSLPFGFPEECVVHVELVFTAHVALLHESVLFCHMSTSCFAKMGETRILDRGFGGRGGRKTLWQCNVIGASPSALTSIATCPAANSHPWASSNSLRLEQSRHSPAGRFCFRNQALPQLPRSTILRVHLRRILDVRRGAPEVLWNSG